MRGRFRETRNLSCTGSRAESFGRLRLFPNCNRRSSERNFFCMVAKQKIVANRKSRSQPRSTRLCPWQRLSPIIRPTISFSGSLRSSWRRSPRWDSCCGLFSVPARVICCAWRNFWRERKTAGSLPVRKNDASPSKLLTSGLPCARGLTQLSFAIVRSRVRFRARSTLCLT